MRRLEKDGNVYKGSQEMVMEAVWAAAHWRHWWWDCTR